MRRSGRSSRVRASSRRRRSSSWWPASSGSPCDIADRPAPSGCSTAGWSPRSPSWPCRRSCGLSRSWSSTSPREASPRLPWSLPIRPSRSPSRWRSSATACSRSIGSSAGRSPTPSSARSWRGVFVLGVVVLSTILASVAEGQTLAVAGSTLAAYALAQPVLRRVRRDVDRRFDRARYDHERTVADFSARLRDEIDVDAVTSDLATTTRSAVAPASLSLWLRSGDSTR